MSDTPALRKARGAFFTPPALCRWLAAWAIRGVTDHVLEPSCGEASFLLALAARLGAGAGPDTLHGIEIHPDSARRAAAALAERGVTARIAVGDFFDHAPEPRYDAVVGNPPYVRYQAFAGAARAKGLQAALSQGVRLSRLASSWAAFTVHAAQFLKPGGRLALVLPAELLSVTYAGPVRRFLLERFARLRLVTFETRVFPGVLEEVVLLLAEGSGGAAQFELFQARGLDDLPDMEADGWSTYGPPAGGKWLPALLPAGAADLYRRLAAGFVPLRDWGVTALCIVTGNNDYFTLTRAEAAALDPADVTPVSPPGGRHLTGLAFTAAHWQALADQGARCLLFHPRDPLAPAARAVIERGAGLGVDRAYKCRRRAPWWRVPLTPVPDLMLTYMNHDRPRLIANQAGVHILNSLYGVTLHADLRQSGRALLPLALHNSLTLLGAEMVGRAYGGGLLKLEPREADLLPLPPPPVLAGPAFAAMRPEAEAALARQDVARAVALVDGVVLAGLPEAERRALGAARESLLRRRLARRGTK